MQWGNNNNQKEKKINIVIHNEAETVQSSTLYSVALLVLFLILIFFLLIFFFDKLVPKFQRCYRGRILYNYLDISCPYPYWIRCL